MTTKLSPKNLTAISDFINSKNGEHVNSLQSQSHSNFSSDYTARHLRELVNLNLIAECGSKRVRTYSKIKDESEPDEPQRSHAYTAPALKVDRHRKELYAQLEAARNSIRSIG